MIFIYENVIANAIKEKLNINITNSEYSKTTFSVERIETQDQKIPFDQTYKGSIIIFKKYKPIYFLKYTINSPEDMPKQSVCKLAVDKQIQDTLKDLDEFDISEFI